MSYEYSLYYEIGKYLYQSVRKGGQSATEQSGDQGRRHVGDWTLEYNQDNDGLNIRTDANDVIRPVGMMEVHDGLLVQGPTITEMARRFVSANPSSMIKRISAESYLADNFREKDPVTGEPRLKGTNHPLEVQDYNFSFIKDCLVIQARIHTPTEFLKTSEDQTQYGPPLAVYPPDSKVRGAGDHRFECKADIWFYSPREYYAPPNKMDELNWLTLTQGLRQGIMGNIPGVPQFIDDPNNPNKQIENPEWKRRVSELQDSIAYSQYFSPRFRAKKKLRMYRRLVKRIDFKMMDLESNRNYEKVPPEFSLARETIYEVIKALDESKTIDIVPEYTHWQAPMDTVKQHCFVVGEYGGTYRIESIKVKIYTGLNARFKINGSFSCDGEGVFQNGEYLDIYALPDGIGSDTHHPVGTRYGNLYFKGRTIPIVIDQKPRLGGSPLYNAENQLSGYGPVDPPFGAFEYDYPKVKVEEVSISSGNWNIWTATRGTDNVPWYPKTPPAQEGQPPPQQDKHRAVY